MLLFKIAGKHEQESREAYGTVDTNSLGFNEIHPNGVKILIKTYSFEVRIGCDPHFDHLNKMSPVPKVSKEFI